MSSKAIVAIALAAVLVGAGAYVILSDSDGGDGKTVCVTMPWQKEMVDEISMGTVNVKQMMGAGGDPHASEVTGGVAVAVSKAMVYLSVGSHIKWEEKNIPVIKEGVPSLPVVEISSGITLLDGGCTCGGEGHPEHEHAKDPHVWTSPKNLLHMAEKTRDTLKDADPDSAATYDEGFSKYKERVDALDALCREKLAGLSGDILVWHGAWKYLFNDYAKKDGVVQIHEEAMQDIPEVEKNPTAENIKMFVDRGYEFLYHGPSDSISKSPEALKESGITAVLANPLAFDFIQEMGKFVNHLHENPPKHVP